MRLNKTIENGEIKDLCEKEAVRMRDLLGETPAAKAAREAIAGVKAAKENHAAAAKATKKADADAKKKTAADAKKTASDEKKAASDEKKKASEEKKKTADQKRTKAADEKDRKRQKSDGLQQIDVKQTTLSFPAPEPQVPESEERSENLTVPRMQKLGEPCPEVVKDGTCGRMDVCYHRKTARDEDEQEVQNRIQADFKESFNKATAESKAYEATKAKAVSDEVPCASILFGRSVGMRGGVRVCMCSRAGIGCFWFCFLWGRGLGHPQGFLRFSGAWHLPRQGCKEPLTVCCTVHCPLWPLARSRSSWASSRVCSMSAACRGACGDFAAALWHLD